MKPMLFLIFILGSAGPAAAQLGASPSAGDFRVHEGSGTAPTVGMPGGPSLPIGPTGFRDPTGIKSPQEVLNQLNKQLGSDTTGSSGLSSGSRAFELQQDLRGSSAGSHPSSENVFK
ncbi:MAG: hypothetical protein ACT4OO_10560 [Nitrospiraceae bacterium]